MFGLHTSQQLTKHLTTISSSASNILEVGKLSPLALVTVIFRAAPSGMRRCNHPKPFTMIVKLSHSVHRWCCDIAPCYLSNPFFDMRYCMSTSMDSK